METPSSAPGSAGASTEQPVPGRRRRTIVAVFVVVVVALAAVGHWAFRLYDPGPSLSMDQVTGVQVAVEEWQPLDLDGPLRGEIEAFVTAASDSSALWPPDLMFP
jgi:hypothetical protein